MLRAVRSVGVNQDSSNQLWWLHTHPLSWPTSSSPRSRVPVFMELSHRLLMLSLQGHARLMQAVFMGIWVGASGTSSAPIDKTSQEIMTVRGGKEKVQF